MSEQHDLRMYVPPFLPTYLKAHKHLSSSIDLSLISPTLKLLKDDC